jgi:hypothetical protein
LVKTVSFRLLGRGRGMKIQESNLVKARKRRK